jgi:hypothetical protein
MQLTADKIKVRIRIRIARGMKLAKLHALESMF